MKKNNTLDIMDNKIKKNYLLIFIVLFLVSAISVSATLPTPTLNWSFNETSGNPTDTISGLVLNTSGAIDYRVNSTTLSGVGLKTYSSSYLKTTSALTNIDNSDFTLSIWFMNVNAGASYLWEKCKVLSSGNCPYVSISPTGMRVSRYGDDWNPTTSFSSNTWYQFVMTYNASSKISRLYLNGVYNATHTWGAQFSIGTNGAIMYNGADGLSGAELEYSNYSLNREALFTGTVLTDLQVAELFSQGTSYASSSISFTPSTPLNATLYNYSITNFTSNLTLTYSANYTNVVEYLYNSSGIYSSPIYDITCGRYIPFIIYNDNHVSACQYLSFGSPSTTNLFYNFTNLTNDHYYLNATTTNSSGGVISTDTREIFIGMSLINVSGYNVSNSLISSFNVVAFDLNNGVNSSFNTSSGLAQGFLFLNHNYSILFNASGFAYQYKNISVVNFSQNVNFTNGIVSNSLNISFFNESNNVPIPITSTITFTGVNNAFSLSSSNATSVFFSNLPSDIYTISVSPSGYSSRSYIVSISSSSSQLLNSYLSNFTSTYGIFTKNLNGGIISGASIYIYKLINTSSVGITQGTTDGSGYITFNLVEGNSYSLIISASGYQNFPFSFTPYIINSPYTFKLFSNSSFIFNTLGNYVQYYYSPSFSFLNGSSQTFTLTTLSLNGSMLYTSINCNNVVSNSSGSPTGSTVNVSISPISSSSQITCVYGFSNVYTGYYSFTVYYHGFNSSSTNSSWVNSGAYIQKNTSSVWLTLLSYFIILMLCLVVKGAYPDPRIMGGIAIIGSIMFIYIGWINWVSGGVSATIGLLLLFMGGR